VIAKAAFLGIARAQIIVIVEPHLPDRHDLRMAAALDHFFDADVKLLMRVVRMRAHRAEHVVVTLGDGQHLVEAANARRDRHQQPDAGRNSPPHHGIELVGNDGAVTVLKAKIPLKAGEIIDCSAMSRNKLREAAMRGDVPGLRKASW